MVPQERMISGNFIPILLTAFGNFLILMFFASAVIRNAKIKVGMTTENFGVKVE
jgi:hypothetical protein